MGYISKPKIVEAFKFKIDEEPKWFAESYRKGAFYISSNGILVSLDRNGNNYRARKGDWIVLDVDSEILCYSDDQFQKIYQKFKEHPQDASIRVATLSAIEERELYIEELKKDRIRLNWFLEQMERGYVAQFCGERRPLNRENIDAMMRK